MLFARSEIIFESYSIEDISRWKYNDRRIITFKKFYIFLPDSQSTLATLRVNLARSRLLSRNKAKKQNARSLIRLIMITRKHRGKSRCDRSVRCHFSPNHHRIKFKDLYPFLVSSLLLTYVSVSVSALVALNAEKRIVSPL